MKMKNIIPDGKKIKKKVPKLGGAVVGGVVTGFVQKGLEKIIPAEYQSNKVNIGATILVGVLLGSNDNPFIEGIGLGMLGVAGKGAGAELGIGDPVMGDIPSYVVVDDVDMGGVPVMGGTSSGGGGEMGY